MDPSDPMNVKPVGDLPNEKVNADNDKTALKIDKLAATFEHQGQKVNAQPEQAKADTFGKIMTGLMGMGSLLGMASTIIAILTYAENRANKATHSTSTTPPGLTPKQQQQIDDDITRWIGLSDEDTWKKLYYLVKNENLTYPQQVMLLNFVVRTRPEGEKWEWDATEKYNLITKLAGDFDDYKMYADVWLYTYKGKHLPFAVAAQVVGLSLTQKYNP